MQVQSPQQSAVFHHHQAGDLFLLHDVQRRHREFIGVDRLRVRAEAVAGSQAQHVLAFFQKLPSCLVGIEACATCAERRRRQCRLLARSGRQLDPEGRPLRGAKRT